MTPLDLPPNIRALFGEDEHPERSWALVDPREQRLACEIMFSSTTDPGVLDPTQTSAMGADRRRIRELELESWYRDWPFYRTGPVKDAELVIESLPVPSPSEAADLIPVPVLTGRPGTGKSKYLKQVVAKSIAQGAWDRRLERDYGFRQKPWAESDRFGVKGVELSTVYFRMPGRITDKQLFERLCERIGTIPGSDPRGSFEKAILKNRVGTLAIDEVQFINFDGQNGKYVHDALKAIQNLGVRLIMSGHNMRQQLRDQDTPARQGSLTQSEARWDWVDFRRLGHSTKKDRAEWTWLLEQIESRLRLAGHEPGEPVLSVEFEEYLWVRTLGYSNHLSALVTRACVAAEKTPSRRITRGLLDAMTAGVRAEVGRNVRIDLWEAGRFNWRTEFPRSLDKFEM